MALTDVKIGSEEPAEKPCKLYDSNGLFVVVSAGGSKLMAAKVPISQKRASLTLGAYPDIGLNEAREPFLYRLLLLQGLQILLHFGLCGGGGSKRLSKSGAKNLALLDARNSGILAL